MSFILVLFVFVFIPAEPVHGSCLEHLIVVASCGMPGVKWIQCIFQGASLKVLTDVDFSFVIPVLLKAPDVPGLELFFQPFLIIF